MNYSYQQRKIIKFLMLCNDEDKYLYTLDDEGYATLIRYLGTKENVIVPSIYEGHVVKHIGNTCFNGNTTIKTAVIPEGIISIQ